MTCLFDEIVPAILASEHAKGPEYGPPPGIALGLRTADREFVSQGGTRDTYGSPLTASTIFDVASVTKILGTTTALLRLISDGALQLSDNLSRFIPPLRAGTKATITVEQALQHRGGFWPWQPLYLTAQDPLKALDYAAEIPLKFAPGRTRAYSDLGFMFLGEVVSQVTALPLRAAISELVTYPLDLKETGYGPVPSADVATSARGDWAEKRMVETGNPYPILTEERNFQNWRIDAIAGEVNDGNAFHALDGISGHAGMFSTLSDLLTYGQALTEATGVGISAQVLNRFLAPGPDPGQVLGFRTYPIQIAGKSHTLYGHPGFTGCAVGFIPQKGISIALVSNRLVTEKLPMPTEQLWDLALTTVSDAFKDDAK